MHIFKERFKKSPCSPQRYRYAEAYQVHLKLDKLEQKSISEDSIGEEALSRIRTISRWRVSLVVSDLRGIFYISCFVLFGLWIMANASRSLLSTWT